MAHVQEVEVSPAVVSVMAIMQLGDVEMRTKRRQQFLAQGFVKIAIIVEQHVSASHIPHHAVGVSVFFIHIFGNQHNFSLKQSG